MRYIRKPSPVEAIKWTGNNFEEINELTGGKASVFNRCLFIGEVIPDIGNMVIKYPDGKIGKMDEADFFKIYETEGKKQEAI